MEWSDRKSVQKGHLGEECVNAYLMRHNVIPYSPEEGVAHPFDRLCASSDKRRLFIAEVKTKARRNHYPDTGINISHYEDYLHIQEKYGIHIHMFFVDEGLGKIYGGWLHKISQPTTITHNGKCIQYPLKQGKIIYFPLIAMHDVCSLDKQSVESLRALSVRSHEYAYSAN